MAGETPTITLASHVLNDYFSITDLSRPLPPSRLDVLDVPGRHGSVVRGRTMGPRTISLRLWAHMRDHSAMYEDMALLASWLYGSTNELTLTLSDENGRIRKVVPDGDLPYDEYMERGNVLLTLTQPDPVCDIGAARTASLSSGGTQSITIGGTHPAKLSISASAAKRNATAHVWSITFDSGDHVRVPLADGNGHAVVIDCGERSASVDGANAMVTLDSDWPELWPGTHTIDMDLGTGAATLTWQERSV